MLTRTTDSKGRVTLGPAYANKHVIVEEVDESEVRIVLARVIPQREAWLHENKQAMAQVQAGLDDARAGRLVEGPVIPNDFDDDEAG